MAKQSVTGYTFPNVPQGWTQDGKHFAIGLRSLFDRIFGTMITLKDVYPVGIIVLTGADEAPFSFGEWTAVTTGITGVYGWKRTR